ncbi:MAG: nitroreductase [Rhodospirillales bacterium]|nr:nitroreductase [Rhodospirillales bacterium]
MTASPALAAEDLAAAVDWALGSRRSIRAFRPDPVPRDLVERILSLAARAPSGTNMQPWAVTVVTGGAKQRLSNALLAAHDDGGAGHEGEYKYYPDRFVEPYLGRRRKVGWDLYGLLGIGRADKGAMHAQLGRNYRFFDAPVGMIVTIDRTLEIGSWLDLGMFLQSICVAARGHGLDSCPQAAFARYHRILREVLAIPGRQVVVCGLSLGKADDDAVENALITERAALEDFVTFEE